MLSKEELGNFLSELLINNGYEVLVFSLRPTAKIMELTIDKQNGSAVSVDDCAKVSRLISRNLREKCPEMEREYQMDVMSPGIDRPLVKLSDFERYKSCEVKIVTGEKIGNLISARNKISGKIKSLEGNIVIIENREGEYRLDQRSFINAKLVLTDELIDYSKKLLEVDKG